MGLLGGLRVAVVVPVTPPHEADALIAVAPPMGLPGQARPIVLAPARVIAAGPCPLVVAAPVPCVTASSTATGVAAMEVVMFMAELAAVQTVGPVVGRAPPVGPIAALIRAWAVAVPAPAVT